MNNVELYRTSNNLQKKGTISYLEEISPKIRWKNSDNRILDIGSGDGGTTTLLKKIIPASYQLLGCDICEKMVDYANDHHGDENTTFTVLDIAGDIPQWMKDHFNHVFSFYALHWVKNQKRVFSNIYNQLTGDGECFIIMSAYGPLFDAWRTLSKNNKWSKYMPDVERYISPYHDSQDPAKELKTIMENTGFVDIDVECRNVVYFYESIPAFKNAMGALIPFDIPKEMFDDFMEDYVQVMRELDIIERNNKTNEDVIRFRYNLLSAHARKPSSL